MDTQVAIQNWPQDSYAAADWIKSNTQLLNIPAVIHVGDFIEWPRDADMSRFREFYDRLGPLPVSLAPGNHDFDHWGNWATWSDGNGNRSLTRFRRFFPLTTLRGVKESHPSGMAGNVAQEFTVSGFKFLMVSVLYSPRGDELAFLDRILGLYPDHHVIVNTHDYMNGDNRSESGNKIWAVIRKHPNVRMVFSGHYYPTAGHREDDADDGHTIYQIMADYQSYDSREPNSYLLLLKFNPSDLTIEVKTFSPAFGKYMTGRQNTFLLGPVEFLASPSTSPIPDPPPGPPEPPVVGGPVKVWPNVTLKDLGRKLVRIIEKYPKAHEVTITSGTDGDHGPGSYHYGATGAFGYAEAIDIGFGDDPVRAAERLRDLAAWLYQFSNKTVELIHTTPFSTDNGFYVKNCVIQNYNPGSGSAGVYDAGTVSAHSNHIHFCTTDVAANEILAILDGGSPTPVPTPSPSGVYGWDASNHDWQRGPVNVQAARDDGIVFFTHKCSEGTTYTDPYYGRAMERAKAAGIPVMGAYHVLWPGGVASAKAEAKTFFDKVNAVTPWWRDVPWVWQGDFEKFAGMSRAPSPEEAKAFLDELKRLAGGKGWFVAYAPKWQYGDSFNIGYDLWASNYNGSGDRLHYRAAYPGDGQAGWLPYSGRKPRILQYADDATIGTQPICDANKFDGSLVDLIALTGHVSSTPTPTPTPPGEDDMWLDEPAGFPDNPGRTWRTTFQEIFAATHSVLNDSTNGVFVRVEHIAQVVDEIKASLPDLSSGGSIDSDALASMILSKLAQKLGESNEAE